MPSRLGVLRRLVATSATLAAFLPAFAALGESRFDRTPRGIHVEAEGTVDAAAHPLDCELCRALTLHPVSAAAGVVAPTPESGAAPIGRTAPRPAATARSDAAARAPPHS